MNPRTAPDGIRQHTGTVNQHRELLVDRCGHGALIRLYSKDCLVWDFEWCLN